MQVMLIAEVTGIQNWLVTSSSEAIEPRVRGESILLSIIYNSRMLYGH